jgi:hypothetical protein
MSLQYISETNIRLGISQAKPDEKIDDMCPRLPLKGTIDLFSLVDTDMLRKVILTTCLLDLIPTTLSEDVKAIVNPSLFTGTFPAALNTAMVKPLLKKS